MLNYCEGVIRSGGKIKRGIMADIESRETDNIEEIEESRESSSSSSRLSEAQLDAKKRYQYIIGKKSVRRKTRRRTVSLVMLIFVLIATLVAGMVYGVLTFIDFNSFRISVERTNLDYLTLSEDYALSHPSSVLSLSGPKNLDNIAFNWINITEIRDGEGSFNGPDKNYIACSFYLYNKGNHPVLYYENITLTNVYKGLEDAIRIMLIKQVERVDAAGNSYWTEPEYRVFAKVGANGEDEYVSGGDGVIPEYVKNPNDKHEEEDWKCISFYSADSGIVTDATYYPLLAKQRIKYGMAVWIEGTDPECTDAVLGGKVSYAFRFCLSLDDDNNPIIPSVDQMNDNDVSSIAPDSNIDLEATADLKKRIYA